MEEPCFVRLRGLSGQQNGDSSRPLRSTEPRARAAAGFDRRRGARQRVFVGRHPRLNVARLRSQSWARFTWRLCRLRLRPLCRTRTVVAGVSPIGVMEPGMIGIMEPVFGRPNGHPDGLKNEQISDRSQALISRAAGRPSDYDLTGLRARCSRRCVASDRWWRKPVGGCSGRLRPIRQNRDCW
jgi:hypothetical protein